MELLGARKKFHARVQKPQIFERRDFQETQLETLEIRSFETIRLSLHLSCQACITVGGLNLNTYCKQSSCQRCCQ